MQEILHKMRAALPMMRGLNERKQALLQLQRSIVEHIPELEDALWTDLHKSAHEAYMTEVSIVLHELKTAIKGLKQWMKPKCVGTPYFLWPSRSKVYSQPYGVVLMMSPWNYPVQLSLVPLISAISAGNAVVLKTSPDAPATNRVLSSIISKAFKPSQVQLIIADKETDLSISQALLAQQFDYIFFTGSGRVGQIVMEAATKHLTPLTLELGGKSPCIVTADADLSVAARRIAWGKFVNAGQTCVAPDYLLVDEKVKDSLLQKIKETIRAFYGDNPQESADYARIVHSRSLERLKGLLAGEQIYCGGEVDETDLYIAPTVLTNVSLDAPVMQDEIFGPILPVITFSSLQEAIDLINERPKPLALYVFGNKRVAKQILGSTSSGGACVNDTLLHLANGHLPFGGVGASGMGAYHGKKGFDTFSHQRSVLTSFNAIDLRIKFPPYGKKIKWLKRLM